jgi:hypothetical protein
MSKALLIGTSNPPQFKRKRLDLMLLARMTFTTIFCFADWCANALWGKNSSIVKCLWMKHPEDFLTLTSLLLKVPFAKALAKLRGNVNTMTNFLKMMTQKMNAIHDLFFA